MTLKKALIVMVGLPRSGKSTHASYGHRYPTVNRDSIRLALHGEAYIAEQEPAVTNLEDFMVKTLMLNHDGVTIDSCHMKPIYRQRWIARAEENNWSVHFIYMATDKDECIRRAKLCDRWDLIPVIERMAESMDVVDLLSKDWMYGRSIIGRNP